MPQSLRGFGMAARLSRVMVPAMTFDGCPTAAPGA
jgi:hypothetical protein